MKLYQCDGEIMSGIPCPNGVMCFDPYDTVAFVLCAECNGGRTAAGPVCDELGHEIESTYVA